MDGEHRAAADEPVADLRGEAGDFILYSKFFANKLGFKDMDAARESIEVIDRLYRQFEFAKDRAGQHHALRFATR